MRVISKGLEHLTPEQLQSLQSREFFPNRIEFFERVFGERRELVVLPIRNHCTLWMMKSRREEWRPYHVAEISGFMVFVWWKQFIKEGLTELESHLFRETTLLIKDKELRNGVWSDTASENLNTRTTDAPEFWIRVYEQMQLQASYKRSAMTTISHLYFNTIKIETVYEETDSSDSTLDEFDDAEDEFDDIENYSDGGLILMHKSHPINIYIEELHMDLGVKRVRVGPYITLYCYPAEKVEQNILIMFDKNLRDHVQKYADENPRPQWIPVAPFTLSNAANNVHMQNVLENTPPYTAPTTHTVQSLLPGFLNDNSAKLE